MKIIKNEYGAKAEIKRKFYKAFCFITRKKLIIDVTGTILTPGNEGRGCRGNGEHYSLFGNLIDCCCDGCDYMMCCFDDYCYEGHDTCRADGCPHK